MFDSLYSFVMLALIELPMLVIGFVLGMLFMRGNYLRVIRWLRGIIRQQERDLMKQTGGV